MGAGAAGRLEELRLAAIERRIEADLDAGRHTTVVAELEGHVREHPLRESLRSQLMLALYRSGRQADALAAYRAARRALVEQCGIEPNLAMQRLERAILNQDPALDGAPSSVAQRSIMVAALVEARTEELATLAAALARRPAREVIVAQAIARDGDLGAASARLQRLQQALAAVGVTARAAAFISEAPGGDLARIAVEQETDLVVADAPERLLDDTVLAEILRTAPCDVAVSVGSPASGPVLVPFSGADHDWSAIEIGAWLARARGDPLWLAGPDDGERDSSRLLASASLALQRAVGVSAEPRLLQPGIEALVAAAGEAAVVVVGLTDRWATDGLGPVRSALAAAPTPTLLVRRGLRPGGLAPPEGLTRFTWSAGDRPPGRRALDAGRRVRPRRRRVWREVAAERLLDIWHDRDLVDRAVADPTQVRRADRLVALVQVDRPFRAVVVQVRQRRLQRPFSIGGVAVHLLKRLQHRLDLVVVGQPRARVLVAERRREGGQVAAVRRNVRPRSR